MWGPITIDHLQKAPYLEWYNESQDEYTSKLAPEYFKKLEDVTVKIFVGTWCGDTKNYFPKFIKTWNQAHLSNDQLEIIAVHNSSDQYKQGPNGEDKSYGLHRVPTFIFYRDNKEIARIVETPITDIETDLAQIAAGIPTKPSYRAVAAIQNYFDTTNIDSIYNDYSSFARELFGQAKHVGELTTYAKKLHMDGEIVKAEFVYAINTSIYKYHPYSYYRNGAFLLDCEKYEEAKEQLLLCQNIKPDYFETHKLLGEIAGIDLGEGD